MKCMKWIEVLAVVAAAAVFGAVAAYFAMASRPVVAQPKTGQFDVITATKIVVIGEDGKPRIVLGGPPDISGLTILDRSGRIRVGVVVLDDGTNQSPRVDLLDKTGRAQATISIVDGEARAMLTNEKGGIVWSAPRRKSQE